MTKNEMEALDILDEDPVYNRIIDLAGVWVALVTLLLFFVFWAYFFDFPQVADTVFAWLMVFVIVTFVIPLAVFAVILYTKIAIRKYRKWKRGRTRDI